MFVVLNSGSRRKITQYAFKINRLQHDSIYSAYIISNRRVRNINIEINLPNESIAGDNCIAETSHDAELLYS